MFLHLQSQNMRMRTKSYEKLTILTNMSFLELKILLFVF